METRRKDATSVVQKMHTSVSFISCVHVGAVLVRPWEGRSRHPPPSWNVPFKIVQSENSPYIHPIATKSTPIVASPELLDPPSAMPAPTVLGTTSAI